MRRNRTFHKKKVLVIFLICTGILAALSGRLLYLMVFKSDYYVQKAEDLHQRERTIKAARGRILDRNGEVLADNKAVCTISVIHSQIQDAEAVEKMLVKELGISEEKARRRVEKVSSMERVKTNVEKTVGDRIRKYHLKGVKVDEDYRRHYPFGELASKVLGFTGGDNQGIVGLEVKYDSYLAGENGRILTITDARGIEKNGSGESRLEPVPGKNLKISLDRNIQLYAQQEALRVMEEKQASQVSVLLINPQNGEIYACVNVPEFDLNHPFDLDVLQKEERLTEKERQNRLNRMWRNPCISDTYEPGSTFKIITMAAGLEEEVVSLEDTFHCGGYRVVDDRRIHCHKRTGHGTETFLEGAQNSCNPVFIDVGLRLGVDRFCSYFQQFGLLSGTGIDLPGEASTIMHKKENIGNVELATMAFGQSFQITPVQLAATVSSLINGGHRVTPHFGVEVTDDQGNAIETLEYETIDGIVSEETSQKVCYILEHVVSDGSGKKAAVEGYAVGGKTATSQTLPRSARRYISSFLGFAPADDPEVLGMVIIHDPQGIYYGGTIAAPVMKRIFENVLPYLGIEQAAQPLDVPLR